MSNRVIILMYHQIGWSNSAREKRFCTSPDDFATQMRWLKETGYTPLSMDAIQSHLLGQRPFPKLGVHITFDDGFSGILDYALPVLQECSIPSTLFAVSNFVGATNEWMWQQGKSRRSLLSALQLRFLSDSGVTIGSHTRTHARLTELPADQCELEIRDSRLELEDILGAEVHYFAYPYGLHNDKICSLVSSSGYMAACTTRSGFNNHTSNPYELHRIDINGNDSINQFRNKIIFGANQVSLGYRVSYFLDRVKSRFGSR